MSSYPNNPGPLSAVDLKDKSESGSGPLSKDDSREELVKHLQKMLIALGFDLGAFGPNKDGVDGKFGNSVGKAIKEFQEKSKDWEGNQLNSNGSVDERTSDALNRALVGAWYDSYQTDVKLTEGKRIITADAKFLSGKGLGVEYIENENSLVIIIKGLINKGFTNKGLITEEIENTSKSEKPSTPASNTFDATKGSKGLSLHFGLRMYKALITWEWEGKWDDAKKEGTYKGVGYSTTCDKHYGTQEQINRKNAILPKELGNEWPDVKLTNCIIRDKQGKDMTITVGGKTYPRYKCFGANWTGDNFTNCCNSQIAALACALGGGEFTVKGGKEYGVDRTEKTYDIADDSKYRVEVGTSPKIDNLKKGALVIFEQTFVTATRYYKSGQPLYGRDVMEKGKNKIEKDYGGMIYAIAALGIGEPLFTFKESNQQAKLKLIRIGDLAATPGHAFLIGDVRYGIWFEGNKTSDRPDFLLDQSSFIDSSMGTLIKLDPKQNDPLKMNGRQKMNEEDCDTLLGMEQAFMDNVKRFLDMGDNGELIDPDSKQRKVKEIRVMGYRAFTANGNYDTAQSLIYDGTVVRGLNCKDPPYKFSPERTRYHFENNGITRPWRKDNIISLGRLYGPG